MIRILVMLILSCVPFITMAAESERLLPVKLRADRVEVDQKKRTSRYIGHVVLTQGSTRLTADKAVAQGQNQSLGRVTAEGSPVTFREPMEDGSGMVEGEAARAEYDAVNRRIELQGRVEIRRNMDRIRAGRATYDMDSDSVHAEKDDQQRVVVAVEQKQPETKLQAP